MGEVAVAVRVIDTTGIFMDSKVEFRAMLDNGFIEVGEEHVVVVVECGLGNDEHAVVFPRMASNHVAAGIGAGAVRANQLPAKGEFKVDKLFFIKFDIAHMALIINDIQQMDQGKVLAAKVRNILCFPKRMSGFKKN